MNKFRAAILQILGDEWLKSPITEDCFDHDEHKMKGAMDLLARKKNPEASKHLIDCPRCRFIYLTLRETRVPRTRTRT